MSDHQLRMPDLNSITIAGKLTKDANLQYIASGTAICKFQIANNRKYKTKTGESKEETVYVGVTVWGKAGEFLGDALKMGAPVIVEGRLGMDQWEDKQTGQKRSQLFITARDFGVHQIDWRNQPGEKPKVDGKYQYKGGPTNSAVAAAAAQEPIPDDDIPF